MRHSKEAEDSLRGEALLGTIMVVSIVVAVVGGAFAIGWLFRSFAAM
jgi:hypothetical protein